MKLRSLQGRLLALVLAVVSLVWIAAALATWNDARHELDELLDGHLAQAAALLVAQQTGHPDEDETVDAPSLHRYAPKVTFQVWHEGVLVLRSANAPLLPIADHLEGFRTRALDGVTWRIFATPGLDRSTTVFVGEQTDTRDGILRAVVRSLLWPFTIALPALAALVWWAVRRGLAPMRALGSTLAQRSAENFEPVVIKRAPEEMLPALDALNRLLQRISLLLDTERRFTADAAHELRTPIAAIRMQAQVAMISADEQARQHALQSTLEGCDRATNVVEQLLTLARVESASGAESPVDAAALTRGVVADLAALALAKQQTLELEADAPCAILAEPTLIGVMVRNLVDNAIRYSPERARILVRIAREQDQVVLHVEDSGTGLDTGQQKRLGERFFRVLGSSQTGSGLGWSIVRRIAQSSGARVELGTSERLGGLKVRVAWPGLMAS
jgi:two-component system sensor histidine kinase QseC